MWGDGKAISIALNISKPVQLFEKSGIQYYKVAQYSLCFFMGLIAPRAQATCLHPLLLAKVREWAAATGGCFRASAGGHFVTEAQVEEGGGGHSDSGDGGLLFQRVVSSPWPRMGPPPPIFGFAKLKSVTRAAEKLVRSYGKVDPTRPC